MRNNSGSVHQILSSRFFREEPKQRRWGKACARKAPWGPAPLHFHYFDIYEKSRPIVDYISMGLLNCFFMIRFKSNFLVRKVGGGAVYFYQQAQYPFGLLSVTSSLIT